MLIYFKFCNNFLFNKLKLTYLFTLFFAIINSFFQLIGVVSIYPLLAFIILPENIINNYYISSILKILEIPKDDYLSFFCILFLTLSFFAVVSQLLFVVVREYLAERSLQIIKSIRYKNILNNGLSFFINVSKSEQTNYENYHLVKIKNFFLSFYDIIGNIICVFVLTIFLTIINPKFSYFIILLIFLFVFLRLILKVILTTNSLKMNNRNLLLSKIFIQILYGYREIFIFNLKNKVIKSFNKIYDKFIRYRIINFLIIVSPRYLIEILAFIFISFYFFNYGDQIFLNHNIPSYSIYIFSAYKIIPLSTIVMRSFFQIYNDQSTLNYLINFSKVKIPNKIKQNINLKFSNFKHVKLKNVKFSYDNTKTFTYNLNIIKSQKCLLRGESGYGKTTLLNIMSMMNLNFSGDYLIDNKKVKENLANFFKNMSYITQSQTLFEGSILYNITFKDNLSKNDLKFLKKIYSTCGLYTFIKFDDLKKSQIGFDAPELSGGQKQRIYLARALFLKPHLLLMDEPFTGLDKSSEYQILDKLCKEYPELTILMVSHRAYDKFFDKIFDIKKISKVT